MEMNGIGGILLEADNDNYGDPGQEEQDREDYKPTVYNNYYRMSSKIEFKQVNQNHNYNKIYSDTRKFSFKI